MINIYHKGSKVLVELGKVEEKTRSGIIIANSEKQVPQTGTVISTGPGRYLENGKRIPIDVNEGDMIIFEKYSLQPIEIDDNKYYLVDESNILAVYTVDY